MINILWQLWMRFFQVGLFSFGGGYATIPLIQSQIVDTMGWLTIQQFSDIITISQMTPGPLAVNISTFVGIQIYGVLGAIVATLGCVISGVVISLLLHTWFEKHKGNFTVKRLLEVLTSFSVGLIAAAAMVILAMLFTNNQTVPFLVAILCFIYLVILRKFKLNPILLIAISGMVGLFL